MHPLVNLHDLGVLGGDLYAQPCPRPFVYVFGGT